MRDGRKDVRSAATALLESMQRRRPPPIPGDTVSSEMMGTDTGSCPMLVNGKEPLCRPAAVILSTYRIVVIPHSEKFEVIEVPCMSIEDIREPKRISYLSNAKGEPGEEVAVLTKLPWDLRLAFRSRRESQGFYQVLVTMKSHLHSASPKAISPLERLFAFDHAGPYREAHKARMPEDGWAIYDVDKELARQTGSCDENSWDASGVGVNLRPWFRICHLDKEDEQFSPTYPSRFVVPRSATNKLLRAVSQYRSRQRIPIVSYVFLKTGAVITRASQPLPGLNANRSQADEVMCESLLSQAYVKGGTPIPSAFHEDQADVVAVPQKKGSQQKPFAPPSLSGAPPSLSGAPPSLAGAPPSLAGAQRRVDETQQMRLMKEKHKRPPTVIFDARSSIAATGNRTRGGGYESSKNYNCRLSFLNMGNIHAVKDSWSRCKKLLEKFNNITSSQRDSVPGPQGPNVNFFSEWERSGWVLHIQRLLYGTVRIVDEMVSGVSCLVHCSDGWDRTSQLTSISMLLIDPYYRTVRGFAMLIEKEWCIPGHKFAERSGHQVAGRLNASRFKEGIGNEINDDQDTTGISKHTKSGSGVEPSPVFLQWADAVFQILRQFPTAFEFTPSLLEFIMDGVYSCRFGTFLCNFDKERVEEKVKANTISIWTEVLRLVELERESGKFDILNPNYAPPTSMTEAATVAASARHAGREESSPVTPTSLTIENAVSYLEIDDVVLRPSCNGKRMAFWESFYLKHDCAEFELSLPDEFLARRRQFTQSCGKDDTSSSDAEEEAGTFAATAKQQLSAGDIPQAIDSLDAAQSEELSTLRSEAGEKDREIARLKALLLAKEEEEEAAAAALASASASSASMGGKAASAPPSSSAEKMSVSWTRNAQSSAAPVPAALGTMPPPTAPSQHQDPEA